MSAADPTGPSRTPGRPAGRARTGRAGHPLLSSAGRTVTALVSAACLLLTATGWTIVEGLGRGIGSGEGLDLGGDVRDGAIDILLVGVDSRTDPQGNPLSEQELATLRAGAEVSDNTDTILLVRIPRNGSSATAISIPRDTYVDAGSMGKSKINGVYGAAKGAYLEKLAASRQGAAPSADDQKQAIKAGRNALLSTVKGLTGVDVDHYAEIGLLGFVLLTDAVGGVPVCLNEAVDEPLSGARFRAGQQTISGADALSFVRQRHDLPAGDLDRIVRQQVFMAQLTRKIVSAGTLTDPTRLNKLVDAAGRSLVIDQSWDVVDFATRLKDLSGGDIRFETIPVTDIDAMTEYGESIVTVDPKKVQQFVRSLAGVAEPTPTSTPSRPGASVPGAPDPSRVTVEIVNTTQTNGLAGSVAAALRSAGYVDVSSSSNPGAAYTSHVSAPTAGDPGAFALAAKLGGLPVQVDPALADGAVRVVLAEDYSGPTDTLAAGPASGTTTTSTAESTSPAVPLPPSIANRPVFDAGDGSVPCVN